LTDALGVTRANLAQRTLVTLRRGGARGPDVLLVEADCGRIVVKDFAARGPLVRRWLAPRLVRRELRAYAALAGHPAVPKLLAVIDPLAFAVEHRGGSRFSRRRPWTFSPAFGRALEAAVREMHARGVVHLDLRHRSNLRADVEGRPVLVDFGAALCFRPGSAAARWCLPALAWIDRRAVRKWRRRLDQSDAVVGAGAGGASGSGRGASRPT
jgi:hypothetical protein